MSSRKQTRGTARGFRTRAWEDLHVPDAPFQIRPARDDDRLPLAVLFAAVAEEGDGIATEPPVDVEASAASWTLDGMLVAAIALYRKFGFVEEGRRVKHDRRVSGELWDALDMGLLL